MTTFTPGSALIGGLLIGTASAWALAMNGRIPGISGICARFMHGERGDRAWRGVFLVGIVAGAAATFALYEPAAAFVSSSAVWQLVLAGLLVGLGTRIGGGCTSGHGVCGLGRGSLRSLVATLTFMAVAVLTVWVMDDLLAVLR